MHTKLSLAVALSAVTLGVAACAAPAPSTAPSAQAPAPAAAADFALDTAGAPGRIAQAGLEVLTAEGNVDHYHAHLDVLKDGKPVAVPANIGITAGPDHRPNGISALHTHDTTGVVHIESPTAGRVFTLGQFLTEWGVLGGSGAPGTGAGPLDGWTLYVNGQKYDAGIRDLPLKAHDEILLSYGAAPAQIAAAYAFPPGE
ncbi:DUF4430 domain-containing protein [Arthrobacter sp. NicSoilB8]|uniref:DUF4430 domain-containing protein n=1 Tax=Arthrobacter sp. NicSoilB8 TaxID=2830998 RepID=UPI001CC44AA4|nr:DUF4430 domain-containing protein [Arthrobacter sp. NicSoilB8]BCW71579.1 hypothetical protein NicSoilB8_26230 [Arthrobacter sp. NicSoilB8]